jgi:hypothetical protein
LGKVNLKELSLPALTFLLGILDGFNPCAMWALIFLITLLIGLKNRRRMFILGTVFIFISGAIYFLFMAAWLNLFIFLGFIIWIRLIIGGAALTSAYYSLRDFFQNKEGVCEVVNKEKKIKIVDRMKKVLHEKSFFWSLIGIIFLAAGVNLIELICSAGLPAIYTQILILNNLPIWQYYLYMLGYIFFYILYDLIIFWVAMKTLKVVNMTGKYSRYSRLVGGILMLIIGILMILKPKWLMF